MKVYVGGGGDVTWLLEWCVLQLVVHRPSLEKVKVINHENKLNSVIFHHVFGKANKIINNAYLIQGLKCSFILFFNLHN